MSDPEYWRSPVAEPPQPAADTVSPAPSVVPSVPVDVSPAPVDVPPAVARFKSCRWRRPPEDGPECCGHRDVLPLAGAISFDPQAWCPDCTLYKLRRNPKKRDPSEYRY